MEKSLHQKPHRLNWRRWRVSLHQKPTLKWRRWKVCIISSWLKWRSWTASCWWMCCALGELISELYKFHTQNSECKKKDATTKASRHQIQEFRIQVAPSFLQRRKTMEKPGKLGRKECNSDASTVVIAMDIREVGVGVATAAAQLTRKSSRDK